jgi:Reverse transcriptase (RNA-dependent DNA polymerase)
VEENTTPSSSSPTRDFDNVDPLDADPSLDLYANPQEAPQYDDEVEKVQIDTTSTKRPLVFDDEAYDDKPVPTDLPMKRNRKKRTIWDPTDVAYTVESVLNDINVPINNVTQKVFDKCADPDSVEGSDATPFLPEPQTLKGVLRLPPRIREAWLKAYHNELVNMIVTKKTFSHPKNYRGEKCLPIRVVYKTKLRSDGKVDKVKVRAAIRGDLDTSGPRDEDNSAPLATFRTLKVFLAEAARRQRHVYQADYVGAYLQAKMDRVIYVTLPAALAEVFPDLAEWFGVPLLLEKAAYGINAAGCLWAEEQFG